MNDNNGKDELRKGIRCLLRGICLIGYAVGGSLNKAAHAYPYALLVIFAIPCVILSMVNVGEARAERDSLNKENYELSVRIDSLQNIYDAKTKTYVN